LKSPESPDLLWVIRVDIAMSALSSAIHNIGHYHANNGHNRRSSCVLASLDLATRDAATNLRTLVAASSAKTAGFGVPSLVPKWRAAADEDGHYCFAVPL